MFPSPCDCCECKGVKCFVDHPGHSHKNNPETCKRCPKDWDWVDRQIFHDNGHVWPGFAGEPDGGNYGGSDF